MFQRHLSLSVICLLSTIVSNVAAADELSRYTVSVGAAGCGTLSITDAGTVRGVMRLGGKPVSFSTTIENDHFSVSAKAAHGARFDAGFTVVGEEIVGMGTLADQSVGISVTPYSTGAFSFCGPGVTPVSVSIRKASARTMLTGSLASNGKFTPNERFNSPLKLKVNKKTGIATGKLGATAFIGIISGDVVSAICDDGSRITVRSFAPFVAPPAAIPTSGDIRPAAPQPKPAKLVGNLGQTFTGSSNATLTTGSGLSTGGSYVAGLTSVVTSLGDLLNEATYNQPLVLNSVPSDSVVNSNFPVPAIAVTPPVLTPSPVTSGGVNTGIGAVTVIPTYTSSGAANVTLGGSASLSGSIAGGSLVLTSSHSGSTIIVAGNGGTLTPGVSGGVLNINNGSQINVSGSASAQSVEGLLRSMFITRPVDTTLLGDPATGTAAIEAALAAFQAQTPQFAFYVAPSVLRAAFYTAVFNQPVPTL